MSESVFAVSQTVRATRLLSAILPLGSIYPPKIRRWAQEPRPGDLERLAPHIEAAIHRVPIFGEVGIKDVVNGPIAYTPDGNPMIGPAFGLRNYWLAEGFSFGVTAAGGAGKYLAEWICEGESSLDMLDVDPRRFGAYGHSLGKSLP